MTELLKQRLVGFAVLILMMVVLVPWVLDHTEMEPTVPSDAAHAMQSPADTKHLMTPSRGKGNAALKKHVRHAQKHSVAKQPLVLHQQTKVVQPPIIMVAPHGNSPSLQAKNSVTKSTPGPIVTRHVILAQDRYHHWLAQVGSFMAPMNARNLLSSLTQANLPAKMQRYAVNGRLVYRVYLGPFRGENEAERLALSWLAKHGSMAQKRQR